MAIWSKSRLGTKSFLLISKNGPSNIGQERFYLFLLFCYHSCYLAYLDGYMGSSISLIIKINIGFYLKWGLNYGNPIFRYSCYNGYLFY